MADETGYGDASDQDLLARHVAGDHEAFGEIVRRHRDRLWAVARGRWETARRPLLTPSRTHWSPPTGPLTPSAASRPSRPGCTASRRTPAWTAPARPLPGRRLPVDDTERLEQLLEPHELRLRPGRAQRSAPRAADGTEYAPGRPARRSRPRGHAGLPRGGGGPRPRCARWHGEEPLRTGQCRDCSRCSPISVQTTEAAGGNKSGGGRNRTQGASSHRQRDRTMQVLVMQDQAIQLL